MTVGLFYKWEDHNHGLEHKCGTCATVLSSPRAKKTCFGVHEEVCPAYHKTLHFVGASHKCAACLNAIEAQSRRHLEIAEIVREIHRLDESSSTDSPLYNNKRKGKKRDDSNPDPSDDGRVHDYGDQEAEWSSTCWSGAMESADVRKAAKAERKAAKNQTLFNIITREELAFVKRALHPESEQQNSRGQGLTNNQTIDENIAYIANTIKWSRLQQTVHAKKLSKTNGGKHKPDGSQQDSEVLGPIIASLGVSTNLAKASKQRKSLDAKLHAAILGDLVVFENDQVETMQRMAGYWRYVNKRTYNEMVRNCEIWDWATGEKLPEIREEAELEAIEEGDENVEADALVGEAEDPVTPESWDDPDFEPSPGGSDAVTEQPYADRNTKDGDIESTGDCTTSARVSDLSYSPGHQPLSTKFQSPARSSESSEQLGDESRHHTKVHSFTLSDNRPARRNPQTPSSKPAHRNAFQGIKDTRLYGKTIHKASPPSTDTPRPPPPAPAPSTSHPIAVNRFGALSHETPAPCDDIAARDATPGAKSVLRIPAKPIVKTLTIHTEPDWQTISHAKGKKKGQGRPGGGA